MRSAFAGAAISAFLFLGGHAQAESPSEVTEAGRLVPFASQREMSRTLEPLIQQAPDCSALDQIADYVIRKRPVLSPSRLDGPPEAVQEGGIVKRYGDYLIVLHRRRLFTVAIGEGALRPAAVAKAISVDEDLGPTEYQELLLIGDRIVLTGRSLEGIEIATFGIDHSGALSREGTWYLRAGPECFSRSYASFVIGDKLVLYSWRALDATDKVEVLLPGLRKWRDTEDDEDEEDEPRYTPTAGPRDVYHKRLRQGGEEGTLLHALTVCDIPRGALKCKSTVLLGRAKSEFHVSESALYIWSPAESDKDEPLGGNAPQGVLYRMAYDGSAPGRIPVSGKPIDRFSFRSSGTDLEVLLTSAQEPEEEGATRPMALLRLPVSDIARGRTVPSSRYTAVPSIPSEFDANRFMRGPQDESAASEEVEGPVQSDASTGVIAVPVRTSDVPDRKYQREGVSLAFFANEPPARRPIGSIASREQDVTDDVCNGSLCSDWFSDARALFIGDRVLVLLGYELIEARRSAGQIVETHRVHFAPPDIFWPERAR